MPNWRLIGPQIPSPVWFSHLLRARGFGGEDVGILWSRATTADWDDLDASGDPERRTLLLIHGTGLRTRPGFVGFTQAEYERLSARYGGRVLAWEHRSFAHHLDRNSAELARALERGRVPLELDVIGLSRGGLVTRMLVEGWAPLRDDIRIRNLIFVGTPNDGTPSARRDSTGAGAKQMRAWRRDVRRLALVNKRDRPVDVYDDPFVIDGFEASSRVCQTWPMLYGSQDQVPASPFLQKLNGFHGPAPHRPLETTYFGLASVFNFEHGAPNATLLPRWRRADVCAWALPGVPNDLVVPTASVYGPQQGDHACGRFPLSRERLMVLRPSSNTTHVGLLRVRAVRRRVLTWLQVDSALPGSVRAPT